MRASAARTRRDLLALLAAALLASSPPLAAAPRERSLDIVVTVDGSQAWRNELQWSRATTQQRYELHTRLRSEGRQYAENLLEPDLQQRMKIKTDYYTYQGLLQLKQQNGGRLPEAATLSADLANRIQDERSRCLQTGQCEADTVERAAAIQALLHNSIEDLEAFIAYYDNPGGRYLYFFGYPDCPNRMRLQNVSHIEGERAYDRDKKKLAAFKLDLFADSAGSAADQRSLCRRYVATVDVGSGDFYLENAFIPSPLGSSRAAPAAAAQATQRELPIPYEVLSWVGEVLRYAPDRGERRATLKLTLPLDGDSTGLGSIDGSAAVSLSWSFKDAAPLRAGPGR